MLLFIIQLVSSMYAIYLWFYTYPKTKKKHLNYKNKYTE